jgi:hypothetical protein
VSVAGDQSQKAKSDGRGLRKVELKSERDAAAAAARGGGKIQSIDTLAAFITRINISACQVACNKVLK